MSFVQMRAYARNRDWSVEVERIPLAPKQELVRLWSWVGGKRVMTDKVALIDDATALDELAIVFLDRWRRGTI